MKLLLIGGTRFSGRALSELALAAGHELTLFHRGWTGLDLFPDAEHVVGDRQQDVSPLAGRRFDAIVDFCGYLPRHVRASAELLRNSGWYGFVSSISAYEEGIAPGTTEEGPVQEPPDPEPETWSAETYGALKVGCERAAQAVFGDRCAIVRPGFIVGPHDPTDRFPSLLRRAAAGGTALMYPDGPVQFVDARDLAAFLLRLAEGAIGGTFLSIHPPRTTTLAELCAMAREVSGADTRFVHAPKERLVALASEDELDTAWPLWARDDDAFHLLDPVAADAAGATHRPVVDTVRDTLAWSSTTDRVAPVTHGWSAEREAELLAALTG
ncbi:MAG: hypothetical protein H6735_28335 [Alphaproteobacteria bacterium]|nr:hypothetical protein [Alphaproteobacteria bacterium]